MFGRSQLNNPNLDEPLEWLVTNGIGGYAAGTVSGVLTRRYHGYLVAALNPPLERTLLVTKFDETVFYNGKEHQIYANSWSSGTIWTKGFHYLTEFRLDGTIPVWTYMIDDALVEKRIWMEQGANTTYITYTVLHAHAPVTIGVRCLSNYRDYHGTTNGQGWQMGIESIESGVRVTPFEGAVPTTILCDGAEAETHHVWYRNYYLGTEAYRGLGDREDNLYVTRFVPTLESGESVTLVVSTDGEADIDGAAAYTRQKAHEAQLLAHDHDPEIEQLLLAADQFIVSRPLAENPDGRTIIAGYPWFGDWGRDTMIALPGLTLTTERPDVARQILHTFAQFVDEGMLPNRFPDSNEEPEYNTIDATLWYFEAIQSYIAHTDDLELARELFPTLQSIIEWHQKGTRYNIKQDPVDGLLYGGAAGVQLTWMDAKVGDWVVTPRTGKAVEINALWYNALMIMADLAAQLDEDGTVYRTNGERVKSNFARFWNEDEEIDYCYDVIDSPLGKESQLRPNQLFAVSLTHSPLEAWQQKAVVDACARELLTGHGLRSLAPSELDYIGTYSGDQVKRDGAYHQGTVWSWLIGPFAAAHLRVYGDKAAVRAYLRPLLNHLSGGCVGNISEIFDGDMPFAPRGCFAQAWGVGELLRAWALTA